MTTNYIIVKFLLFYLNFNKILQNKKRPTGYHSHRSN
uniref:Uncharacterized protein n=1 Tax=Siphoviridae sp. ctj6w2 TaxID=2827919 RepID=A0A8S5T8F1_9CAUD|nr:MAG TPA: hypothetical protein [Siphoviridae sp. ctj6w2]DAK23674.1 MAG TPA: hypothetical protein [Caudoviricetes sp.]